MRARAVVTGLVTGMLFVGSVWAGVGLAPVPDAGTTLDDATGTVRKPVPRADLLIGDDGQLGQDQAWVGAAKVDIEPDPDAWGGTWVRDADACTPLTSGDVEGTLTHAADPRITWIENNNCIYMGGFGLGPSQPVLAWDSYDPDAPVQITNEDDQLVYNENGYGLWSRSFAVARGGGALVLTILDAEGYFATYNRMCGSTPCGAHDLADQLAAELAPLYPGLGITAASFVFASTHAHSAMDFIGGWGGVPQWYMDQVAEAMRDSVRDAVASMSPATLIAGDTLARGNNGERRDLYWSAEDPTVNWLRALDEQGATIATVGTFAAHATSFGGGETKAHADWPGVFDKRIEERFGGVGLMFEAGLGNMSARGNGRGAMGVRLADLIPETGTQVSAPDVSVARRFWDQPVTNGPLAALGGGGFFDRPFSGPAVVEVGKSSANPCRSASAVSARVSVTAARVGDVVVTAAPGEIFANFSNTIEERSPITALAIGQANDAIGYMPQAFETNHLGRQGLGFVASEAVGYEDAYSIDACFGTAALAYTLDLLNNAV